MYEQIPNWARNTRRGLFPSYSFFVLFYFLWPVEKDLNDSFSASQDLTPSWLTVDGTEQLDSITDRETRNEGKKKKEKEENWLRLYLRWSLSELIKSMFPLELTDLVSPPPCVLVDHHLRRPALFLGGYVRQGPKRGNQHKQSSSLQKKPSPTQEEEEEEKGSDNGAHTWAPFIFDN